MHSARRLRIKARRLEDGLQTKYIGNRVMWFKSLSSTQEFAKHLISTDGILHSNGYVIISDSQRNGVGRHGSKWVSPKGGIWLSIILSSTLHPSRIILFSYCASLAVSEAIDGCTGTRSRVKWPNDILIQGKKVSGILVDASVNSNSIEHMIVGIGVNANVKAAEIERNTEGLEQPVTSLQEQLGTSCDTVELTKRILQTFDEYYYRIETDDRYPLIDKWKERAEPIASRPVQISHGADLYVARVLNLEEDGSLVVMRDDNQIEKIVTAEYRVHITD